jgi:hypothetical protein
MPGHVVIVWVLKLTIVGAAAWVFWKALQAWATAAVNAIIQIINFTTHTIFKTITLLIRKGGSIYRSVRVWVRAKNGTNKFDIKTITDTDDPVHPDDLDEELESKLRNKEELVVGEGKGPYDE